MECWIVMFFGLILFDVVMCWIMMGCKILFFLVCDVVGKLIVGLYELNVWWILLEVLFSFLESVGQQLILLLFNKVVIKWCEFCNMFGNVVMEVVIMCVGFCEMMVVMFGGDFEILLLGDVEVLVLIDCMVG